MIRCTELEIGEGLRVPVYTLGALIIGSGAASLNCAEHLIDMGYRDIAIATDRLGAGASNNSGSDKQTYYKMSIFGDASDSPIEFAKTLAAGGMMHGDIAYVEGACSLQEFFHLVKNGVPFPFNRFGAYVGYKTDFDPRQRATSAGPKTSMYMVQCSLAQLRKAEVLILDGHAVVALLTHGEGDGKRVIGALALRADGLESENFGLVAFNAANVVMGTGGPGEMYKSSVYPVGQVGNHGIALEIGAAANNLTESQFGLASMKFRWNLSGSYQQVIPAYFSTSADGSDRRYFLNDYFNTTRQQASNVFLKGYQWPFDAEKVQNMGSSIIDIAVQNEIAAGRRVFMDFARNPVPGKGMEDFSLENLAPEARRYLENCGALQGTPYERLKHMNPLSIEVYNEHGVDLRQPLEVAVCSQHNNGGLRGNVWWESNIRHLFPVGEVNGTHGVRPGGSALNSGQVGGLRAAAYISRVYREGPIAPSEFLKVGAPKILAEFRKLRSYVKAGEGAPAVGEVRSEIQERMSAHAAFIRSAQDVPGALEAARRLRARISRDGMRLASRGDLIAACENEHLCLTHVAFLEALKTLIERGGGSRGSYMVLDEKGDRKVTTKRGAEMPHRSENVALRKEILEIQMKPDGEFSVRPVPVRPVPQDDSWYENTWRKWLEGRVFRP